MVDSVVYARHFTQHNHPAAPAFQRSSDFGVAGSRRKKKEPGCATLFVDERAQKLAGSRTGRTVYFLQAASGIGLALELLLLSSSFVWLFTSCKLFNSAYVRACV
uniref:Uncharacterized protein n=1 Tax=Anopheles albimanus TaxID=7167 RepID=A0A182F5P2_ANOAL